MSDPRTDPYFNARRALAQLETFAQQSRGSDMDRAAVIQAFEFTFETFWKAFKKIVEQEGEAAPFPRSAIAGALEMIDRAPNMAMRRLQSRHDGTLVSAFGLLWPDCRVLSSLAYRHS